MENSKSEHQGIQEADQEGHVGKILDLVSVRKETTLEGFVHKSRWI